MAPGNVKSPIIVADEEDEIPCNGKGPPVNDKGRKLKSEVWQHMGREVLPDKSVKATCNYCSTVLTANKNSGTSHLKRHIHTCPKRFNQDIRNYCLTGAETGSGTLLSMKKLSVNLEEVRRAICIYVVAGAHPFTTCEEPGFKYMIRTMCPQFNLISRHTLKRDAMKYFKDEKHDVANLLQNTCGRISFTTDNWRSEHTDDEYMCITAHWIGSNWELQKRIIKFAALTPPFDGQSLADEIALCLGQWKIDSKVLGFTVDNASYNDSMIGYLKSDLSRKNFLFFGGEFFHVSCACHIINLVVQAGLRLIDDVVVKIRSIVKHLKHSVPKKKHFFGVAETMFHLDTKKRLRGDNLIRWNSTFLMLDRFLYYKDVVDHVVGRDRDIKVFVPTIEEWKRVSELRDFLKVFYDVTNIFSASNTPTSNLYFHGVWKIHKKLVEVSDSPSNSLSVMAKEMEKKFEKYWSDYSLLLSCAAVLDPRYKLDKVEYCYELFFGETYAKEIVQHIKETLVDLLNDYKGPSDHISTSSFTTNNTGSSSVAIDKEEIGFIAFMNRKRKSDHQKTELELYLEERVEDIDVLPYWKNNSIRFPNLSCMARDILAIPISTVPSESAFSMGKKLINPWRASLGKTAIEALACYEDWLRAKKLSLGPSLLASYGDTFGLDEDDGEDLEVEDDSTFMRH